MKLHTYLNYGGSIACALLVARAALADPIPVRHVEGRIHGFLLLRDAEDRVLATGVLTQGAAGGRVTTQLTFHFKDGSLQEETAVYSQRRVFQLNSYHLVQKGPAFKHSIDMTVNAATGQVTVRSTEADGKEKRFEDRMKLPADLANGLVSTLLGDVDPKAAKTTLSMVVATPKPRVVKLEISPAGEDSFSVGGTGEKSIHYVIKIDIGGISGAIAPIVGKQPPDIHVWMVGGRAPGFLKSEGPMYQDGPVWKIELASPVWPKKRTE